MGSYGGVRRIARTPNAALGAIRYDRGTRPNIRLDSSVIRERAATAGCCHSRSTSNTDVREASYFASFRTFRSPLPVCFTTAASALWDPAGVCVTAAGRNTKGKNKT